MRKQINGQLNGQGSNGHREKHVPSPIDQLVRAEQFFGIEPTRRKLGLTLQTVADLVDTLTEDLWQEAKRDPALMTRLTKVREALIRWQSRGGGGNGHIVTFESVTDAEERRREDNPDTVLRDWAGR